MIKGSALIGQKDTLEDISRKLRTSTTEDIHDSQQFH